MRLTHAQHKFIYNRLIQDVREYSAKLLIVPVMTVDALASARIISSTLQQLDPNIHHSIMPVRGKMDLMITIEAMIEETDLSCETLSIILLGLGGGINLHGQFRLNEEERQNIFFTVFDSHRPFNLRNLNRHNDNVRIILDKFDRPDDWDEHIPLDIPSDDENFFYTTKSQYIEFAHEDEDDYDQDDADNGNITKAEMMRRYNEATRTFADEQGYDDEDDDAEYSLGDDNDEAEHEESASSQNSHKMNKKRTKARRNSGQNNGGIDEDELVALEEAGNDAKVIFSNNNNDDDYDDDSTTKNTTKKRKHHEHLLPPPRKPKISYHAVMEHHKREPMSLKELQSIKQQWYARQTYSVPTSVIIFNIAFNLQAVQQSSFTWAALLGLHESLMYERIAFPFYAELLGEVATASAYVGSSRDTIKEEPGVGSHRSKNNYLQMKQQYNSITNYDSQQEVKGEISDLRHQSSSTLVSQYSLTDQTFDTSAVTSSGIPTISIEHNLLIDKHVQSNYEYIFPFFRHWTFYDALINTPNVIIGFNLLRAGDSGYATLKRTFPSVIPLNEAQNQWSLLSKPKLISIYKFYGAYLHNYKIHTMFHTTFIKKYSASMILSLFDMVSIILQYLSGTATQQAVETVFKTKTGSDKSTALIGPNIPSAAKSAIGLVRQGANTLTNVMSGIISCQPIDIHTTSNHSQSILVGQLLDYNNQQNTGIFTSNIDKLGTNTLFWPAYNLLAPSHQIDGAMLRCGLTMAMKQWCIINMVAQNIISHYLNTADFIHYCFISNNSSSDSDVRDQIGQPKAKKAVKTTAQKPLVLSLEYVTYLTNPYALTQLAFRIQENLPPGRNNTVVNAPLIICLEIPFQSYSMVIGMNPVQKTPKQLAEGSVASQFCRNTYSHFNTIFNTAALKMGVDIIRDSFDYNVVFVKNDDCLKFIHQMILLVSLDRKLKESFFLRPSL